jgi:hypothetical protein
MTEFKNVVTARSDGTMVIDLSQGRKAIVDDTPAVRTLLAKYRFYCNRSSTGKPYAKTSMARTAGKRRTACLHQLLIPSGGPGFDVDHVNGDTLDNRMANLRVVSHRINSTNRVLHRNNKSGVCGLSRRIGENKWIAKWVGSDGVSHAAGFADLKYGGSAHARELAIAKLAEMRTSLPVYAEAFSRTIHHPPQHTTI